ncbi:hypothetical protein BX600DRAFT_275766 [Xylariales sp. PMI_506]|nr:hypothetical protein BX600DRAFT_275766 [Xylariales sp. PMI_506]
MANQMKCGNALDLSVTSLQITNDASGHLSRALNLKTTQHAAPRRRPVPRKGHKKSRRGCFQCKRRKVKCPENTPECAVCQRLGFKCEYPSLELIQAPTRPLQTTPGTFSLEDLRFFHHFMVTAYPPLPIGSCSIWRQISAVAHGVRSLPLASRSFPGLNTH